ncbi:hypothetical protein QAD02_007207 [Eretmocerus hayati]|uniref:Uncharacterized protein n=1 Tax=Eretmocerus hayati TaxID=131215 RepID=A0ACC2N305_9HYME|nr:hypothetical protein QAD02_007207 [Eretmocerus hayati]
MDGVCRNHRDPAAIRDDLDRKLILHFTSCNISFRSIENESFINFVNTLLVAGIRYTLPHWKTVAGPILESLAADIDLDKIDLFNGTRAVLMIDGYKVKNANIKLFAFSMKNIHCDIAFLAEIDISLESETAANLWRIIQFVTVRTEARYNVRIVGAVHDGDPKIVAAVRDATNSAGGVFWQSTCNSHSGNLLVHHFANNDQMDKVKAVVTLYKEPRFEALLIRAGGTRVKNPPPHRFHYAKDAIASIVRNWDHLEAITVAERARVPDRTAEYILNDGGFRYWLDRTYQLLIQICRLIKRCESPKYNVADATQEWMTLDLRTDEYDQIIRERIEKAVYPVGCLANMLHPRYRGNQLTPYQRRLGELFMRNRLSQGVNNEYLHYINNIGNYARLADASTSAIDYWTLVRLRYQHLGECAVNLMLMPASIATLEGMFSGWGWIHSPLRNRLSLTTSSRLQVAAIIFFVKNERGLHRRNGGSVDDQIVDMELGEHVAVGARGEERDASPFFLESQRFAAILGKPAKLEHLLSTWHSFSLLAEVVLLHSFTAKLNIG